LTVLTKLLTLLMDKALQVCEKTSMK